MDKLSTMKMPPTQKPNRVTVILYAEAGLDPWEGEYDARLVAFERAIDLHNDDIDQILEAIHDEVECSEGEILLPPDGTVEAVFVESVDEDGDRCFLLESWRVIGDEELMAGEQAENENC